MALLSRQTDPEFWELGTVNWGNESGKLPFWDGVLVPSSALHPTPEKCMIRSTVDRPDGRNSTDLKS